MSEKRFLCGRHGVYEGESCWECDGEVSHDNEIRAATFEKAAKIAEDMGKDEGLSPARRSLAYQIAGVIRAQATL